MIEINDEMTLDEKLALIDSAMKPQALYVNQNEEVVFYCPDPSEELICDGCQ